MTEKDRLICIISDHSDRYGGGSGGLIEFMDAYGLKCLADATVEQPTEFIKANDRRKNSESKCDPV